jgi:hypothetical protein
LLGDDSAGGRTGFGLGAETGVFSTGGLVLHEKMNNTDARKRIPVDFTNYSQRILPRKTGPL